MFKVKWTGDVCQLIQELMNINEEIVFVIKGKRIILEYKEFYCCAFLGDTIEIPDEVKQIEILQAEEVVVMQPKLDKEHMEKMYKEWGLNYTG